MVAIEKASEMFNSLGLEKFQAEGLLRLYAEYLDSNKRRNKDRLIFEVCPKCGKVHHKGRNVWQRKTDVQVH